MALKSNTLFDLKMRRCLLFVCLTFNHAKSTGPIKLKIIVSKRADVALSNM